VKEKYFLLKNEKEFCLWKLQKGLKPEKGTGALPYVPEHHQLEFNYNKHMFDLQEQK
jgi:hypothetical protein